MKRKLFVLMLIIISISLPRVVLAQWAEYDLPAPATAVTVTETTVYVFIADRWFQADLPLPASGEAILWAENLIPGSGLVKSAVVTPGGLKFVLRDNGDLWRLSGGQWENIMQNIDNLSAIKGDRFFAWSNEAIYEYQNGFTQMPFAGAKAIAFNDNYVMVFTEDFKTWSGPQSWNLSPAEDIADLHPAEAVLSGDDSYVLAGEVVGGLAAWHQSPADACFKYSHVLTPGRINSVACTRDTVWAVGWIGTKGCLFNTADLASLTFVHNNVWQVRANANGVVAAVGNDKLLVYGNPMVVGSKDQTIKPISDLTIMPNPIDDGFLRVVAPSARQVNIFNLSGQSVVTLLLDQGENLINVIFLPAGTYIIDGQKFVVR